MTDESGRHRLDSFDTSGAYQVRLAESNDVVVQNDAVIDVLISRGDESLCGLNFQVIV
ncbi:MAG: hypothetical protein AAF989_04875 [Planctomycetota bacterium]